MNRIKKGLQRKKKATETRKPVMAMVFKYRQRFLMMATCLTVAVIMVATVGASAKNLLLSDPDIRAVSRKVREQIREFKEANTPQTSQTGAQSPQNDAMPSTAKPARTQAEAKQVVRPLVMSNSAITYDPWGRLAKIVEPDSTVRQFVYSGNRLCEERDGSGAVTKQFFDWGETISGTKYFYTRNHEGSVTEMTDSSGNVVAQYQYDPYGNVRRVAGSGPDSDFLYAGYFYHVPSGLYITEHRLYNPKLGRWINRDPIDDPTFAMMPRNPESSGPNTAAMASALAQPGAPANPNMVALQSATNDPMIQAQLMRIMPHSGLSAPGPDTNPYLYADNNPVSITDPSGLQGWNPWRWWRKWCKCNAGCKVAQDWAYDQCIRSGKSPILCKVIADGAYHTCMTGCMAAPELPD